MHATMIAVLIALTIPNGSQAERPPPTYKIQPEIDANVRLQGDAHNRPSKMQKDLQRAREEILMLMKDQVLLMQHQESLFAKAQALKKKIDKLLIKPKISQSEPIM
jgi:hypothetical protein